MERTRLLCYIHVDKHTYIHTTYDQVDRNVKTRESKRNREFLSSIPSTHFYYIEGGREEESKLKRPDLTLMNF